MNDVFANGPIVVGVDGSRSAILALRHAAALSAALERPLQVVTVWAFPAFADPAMIGTWSPEDDAIYLLDDAIKDAFAAQPPERLTRRVLNGPAAQTLIAASADATMLVLGSRGHGGFAGLLLGSVSAACAEYARCPVLIVHDRPRETAAA